MISIIIPTLNEERIIASTIDQFRGIQAVLFEIIIADAGSTDTTITQAHQAFGTLPGHVVNYPTGAIPTIAANRNNGASFARGDIFLFMDADARLENPEKFLLQIEKRFQKNPRLAAVIPRLALYKNISSFLGRVIYAEINFNFWLMNNILGIGGAMGKCQAVRRASFEHIGGYRKDLPATEDMDLFFRLRRFGQTRFDGSLTARLSARRQRTLGWFKWLFIINLDQISYQFRKKVVSKAWNRIG